MNYFKELALASLLLLSLNLFSQKDYPFQNSEFPLEERIDDLISRLTIEEKASFLVHSNPVIGRRLQII